jgi:hypothetical protein
MAIEQVRFESESFFFNAVDAGGLAASRLEACREITSEAGTVTVAIPPEHSRILFFARQLFAASAPQREYLVMPTLWGVWPSSENWHLYRTLRAKYGATDMLKDRPCHCFTASESETAADFLYLFLLFSWDFYAFAYRKEDVLFVSHDGFANYFSPYRTDDIQRALAYLNDEKSL